MTTGSGNKTFHTFAYGDCTRCGRSEGACNNAIGCDGHAWEHVAATFGNAGNVLRPEMLWCQNCSKESLITWGKKYENPGGKCEPPEPALVGQHVNGPKNPPLKGSANASR
jgi:hypothetical protein